MLRFLIRRLPRFGFLTLFAAMLLFVSGAGWIKFHYDLYQEEERLFADLAKAGCNWGIQRDAGDEAVSIPCLDRTAVLGIEFPAERDEALVARAAKLPFLVCLTVGTPNAQHRPEDALKWAPADLAPLPEPALPADPEALPEGAPLDETESAIRLKDWRAIWTAPPRTPLHGVVRVRSRGDIAIPRDELLASSPDVWLKARGNLIQLTGRSRESLYDVDDRGPVETARMAKRDVVEFNAPWTEENFRAWATARWWLESTMRRLKAFEEFQQTLAGAENLTVRRIDDRRFRIDFPPMTVRQTEFDYEDEIQLNAVFRSDLDQQVEAFDAVVRRRDLRSPATFEPTETRFLWRGIVERSGDFVVVRESVSTLPDVPAPPQRLPRPQGTAGSYLARYDLRQPTPPYVFEPATYGAIELPPPRPLPVWRWYRATFVLSLALFAFILTKKVVARFRRTDGTLPSSESADAELAPADAEAIASR